MTKFIKLIVKELTPPIIQRFIRFILRKTSIKENVDEIIEITNEDISSFKIDQHIRLSTESLIIGNGPSFKFFMDYHKSFIDGKIVFCVNSFADTEYFEKIKPQFYIFADPAYWNRNCSGDLLEELNRTCESIKKKVTWSIYILFPIAAREWNFLSDLPSQNSNINIIYYNNQINFKKDYEFRYKLYKSNQAMIHCQNVLVAAIFLSLNLGFKASYLVGADLSLHEEVFVNKLNTVCHKQKHFYDEGTTSLVPFWKDNENTATFKMHELFEAFSLMFKGFTELEEYSKYLGAKIYNISNKSYIDAFERLDLDAEKKINSI